jgi:transcriptional regulator with XRE-family HTH domain
MRYSLDIDSPIASEGVKMADDEKRSSRPTRPDGYYELRRVVAANIRTQRQRRNWSLENVAQRLAPYLGQMGTSTISTWENSRQDGAKGFTVEELYALARVFNTRLATLLMHPTLLDMPEVEKLPGEENWEELILVLPDAGLRNSWSQREWGPDEAPF